MFVEELPGCLLLKGVWETVWPRVSFVEPVFGEACVYWNLFLVKAVLIGICFWVKMCLLEYVYAGGC